MIQSRPALKPVFRFISVIGIVKAAVFPGLLLAAAGLLSACVEQNYDQGYVEKPVDEIYDSALDSLKANDYTAAAKLFDEVERQHPYSSWATKSQLMAAYSYYLGTSYDDAVIALEHFIQLHPSNKDVPYAYYLKGLSYYEQISDVSRDQAMTKSAMSAFKELITRFPQSKYARDAKVKLDLTVDHLAGKEMAIGRYYQKQKQYLAAINRFRRVVEKYQSTTHVPEALTRLAESYMALGLVGEAKKVTAVLGYNFPGSEWYVDSYELVTGKQIRPKENANWYEVWKPDQGPRVRPINTMAPPPWYKVWGLDEAKKKTGTPKTPKQGKDQAAKPAPQAEKEAGKEAGKEEAWYKFW
ncbi:MAG TPA: outer membrane protein assembly factor BamD [Rhodospirillales bacterium]|nr:outer membrane protein assembly factor BamD [Rhodospirillales bacterium]